MKFRIVVIFLVGFVCGIQAQTSIQTEVNALLSGGMKDETLLKKVLENPEQGSVCAAMKTYLADSSKKNRELTIAYIRQAERKFKDLPTRKTQLDVLFYGIEKLPLKDSKPSISLMCKFEKNCFTDDQIDLVRDYLAHPTIERRQAVLLLGFVGRADDADYLNAMASLYPLSKEDNFYLQLAQVRLKSTTASQQFLAQFNSSKINDDFTTTLLKDVAYTQNREAYSKLLSVILSDEANCMSANNDANEKIPCAYRLIEALGPNIQDFPVKIDRSGEIIGSPEEELQKARDWIQLHLSDLVLIDTRY